MEDDLNWQNRQRVVGRKQFLLLYVEGLYIRIYFRNKIKGFSINEVLFEDLQRLYTYFNLC